MIDILSVLRQYGVPFNDPCDPNYRGVCHCETIAAAEQIVTQLPITVCGVSHIAGTPITDILAGVCVPNGDDDWRFTSGSTNSDHIYHTGNVSIGSMSNSHALRTDGSFLFTPVGGQFFTYDNLWQFTGITNIQLGLNYNSITNERDTIGQFHFQVGGTDVATIQAVAAGDHTGGAQATNLEFYVSESTTKSVAMVIQNDYRLRLSKYGSFSDGIPDTLLGLEASPSNLVSRHEIAGTPNLGTILGVGASGLEWLSPAAASSLPAVNGLSQISSQYELGGSLTKDTSIINTGNTLTFGNTTNPTFITVEQDATLGRWTVFSRNTTNNDEVSIVTTPEYHSIECNQDGNNTVVRVGDNSVSINVNDGTSTKFINVTAASITITGLPQYASEAAASADAGLPSNALYRVIGDANLKMK